LSVIEERPFHNSVVLMTCDAMSVSVMLVVVGQDGKVVDFLIIISDFHMLECQDFKITRNPPHRCCPARVRPGCTLHPFRSCAGAVVCVCGHWPKFTRV
jgi:hypothetical protein